MQDHLWAGVDLKLRDARNTLDEMRNALRPPLPTKESIIQESTGTIVGGPDWQTKFYQLVARFLAEVRSVPWAGYRFGAGFRERCNCRARDGAFLYGAVWPSIRKRLCCSRLPDIAPSLAPSCGGRRIEAPHRFLATRPVLPLPWVQSRDRSPAALCQGLSRPDRQRPVSA